MKHMYEIKAQVTTWRRYTNLLLLLLL